MLYEDFNASSSVRYEIKDSCYIHSHSGSCYIVYSYYMHIYRGSYQTHTCATDKLLVYAYDDFNASSSVRFVIKDSCYYSYYISIYRGSDQVDTYRGA
jgi:hypothetical protein